MYVAKWLMDSLKYMSRDAIEKVADVLIIGDKGKARAPRDDHGHYYKTAGAPCPHKSGTTENKQTAVNETENKESGAETGAKKTEGWKDRHANRYYDEIRKRKPFEDADKISKNVDISRDDIESIRNHMFIEEHDLSEGRKRFDPSFEQSQAWQRLVDGKGTDLDKLMLHHEFLELTLMREKHYNYDEAHTEANKKYNWWREFRKRYPERAEED